VDQKEKSYRRCVIELHVEIQHGIQDQIFFLGGNEKVCYCSSMGKYSMALWIRKKAVKGGKRKVCD